MQTIMEMVGMLNNRQLSIIFLASALILHCQQTLLSIGQLSKSFSSILYGQGSFYVVDKFLACVSSTVQALIDHRRNVLMITLNRNCRAIVGTCTESVDSALTQYSFQEAEFVRLRGATVERLVCIFVIFIQIFLDPGNHSLYGVQNSGRRNYCCCPLRFSPTTSVWSHRVCPYMTLSASQASDTTLHIIVLQRQPDDP